MYEIALKGSKLSLVALFDLKLHILTFNFFAEFRSGLSYCTANGAQPYVGKSWKSISRVRRKKSSRHNFFPRQENAISSLHPPLHRQLYGSGFQSDCVRLHDQFIICGSSSWQENSFSGETVLVPGAQLYNWGEFKFSNE